MARFTGFAQPTPTARGALQHQYERQVRTGRIVANPSAIAVARASEPRVSQRAETLNLPSDFGHGKEFGK